MIQDTISVCLVVCAIANQRVGSWEAYFKVKICGGGQCPTVASSTFNTGGKLSNHLYSSFSKSFRSWMERKSLDLLYIDEYIRDTT
jgi:hypothetical protein